MDLSRKLWFSLIFSVFSCVEITHAVNQKNFLVLKCCPERQILSEIAVGNFECVDRVTGTDYFQGYNIKITNNTNIPKCNTNVALIAEPVRSISTIKDGENCVDLNGRGENVILFCNNVLDSGSVDANPNEVKTAAKIQPVYELFKCCKVGESFNADRKICVSDNSELHAKGWQSMLNDGAYAFFIHSPHCARKTEVQMQVRSDKYTFRLLNGSLSLNEDTRKLLVPGAFCLERGFGGNFSPEWIAKICVSHDICQRIPCVHKCCNDGEWISRDQNVGCSPHAVGLIPEFHSNDTKQLVSIASTDYGLYFHLGCVASLLVPDVFKEDVHIIDSNNGQLIYLNNPYKLGESSGNFCVEYSEAVGGNLTTYICNDQEPDYNQIAQGILGFVSLVFIILTFIIYAMLPHLRDLHGKILLSHLTCLFCGYMSLGIIKIYQSEIDNCTHLSYFMYFSFIAAFTWLNIKCFDIFFTIRSVNYILNCKNSNRFLYYSMYGWGLPICTTGLTKLMDSTNWVQEAYRPNLGMSPYGCWFRKNGAFNHLVYFIVPIALMIIANIVFFILTVIEFKRTKTTVRKNRGRSGTTDTVDYTIKYSIFILNTKLFLLMGVLWMFEVLSVLFPKPEWLWVLTDYLNMLQGVFIFIIFVTKRNILTAIRTQFGFTPSVSMRNRTSSLVTQVTSIRSKIDSTELK